MSSSDQTTAHSVARALFAAGAITLRPEDPFTWASGLRAPIYCDNRLTLSLPATRSAIATAFVAAIEALELAPDAVVGVATAGIPQATLVADRLDLPMGYVRGAAKAHGRQNRIEGRLEPESRVVVIEDLISTGGSSLSAVAALRDSEIKVAAVLAVFTYGLPEAEAAFADAKVPLIALADLDALLDVARASEALTDEQVAVVRAWRRDPGAWDAI